MNMTVPVNSPPVNKPAPLRNVAAFTSLINRVVHRRPGLPGLACFYGHSGLGKTKSAIFGANRHRAAYVECGQMTTARSLLVSILMELGLPKPKGTATDMLTEIVEILARDPRRPLIIDEAHHIAHKAFVDVVRELHDKSDAPIVLIGEETLPKHLEAYERVHNRMLDWVAAVPCNGEDFGMLARTVAPKIRIGADLASEILDVTAGNTRRIVVNLAKAEEVAAREGLDVVDLAAFGGREAILGLRAPMPRASR